MTVRIGVAIVGVTSAVGVGREDVGCGVGFPVAGRHPESSIPIRTATRKSALSC